jgi:hypothetical protein
MGDIRSFSTFVVCRITFPMRSRWHFSSSITSNYCRNNNFVIYSDSYGEHLRIKLYGNYDYIGTKKGEIFCGYRSERLNMSRKGNPVRVST